MYLTIIMHINQVDSSIILTERFIKRPYCYISFAFHNNIFIWFNDNNRKWFLLDWLFLVMKYRLISLWWILLIHLVVSIIVQIHYVLTVNNSNILGILRNKSPTNALPIQDEILSQLIHSSPYIRKSNRIFLSAFKAKITLHIKDKAKTYLGSYRK
jgi:hypothetical protein